MRNLTIKTLMLLICGVYTGASAAENTHTNHGAGQHLHTGNEPIGVMGAHVHGQGDWMFFWRGMRMEMEGNRDGADRMRTADVFARGFMIAPQKMTMDMQMPGAMYGVSDTLTMMLMVPYLDIEMEHITAMGARFKTASEGVGDVRLSGLYRLMQWGHHELNLNAGISFPTGSIDEKDDTPAGTNQHLPYPMQLGSGTYDLLPGLTYIGHADDYSWGAQGVAVVRTGENDNGYTLGDRFQLGSWLSKDWSRVFSSSVRLNAQWWGNIDGADKKLSLMAPGMVPTADPDLRAGRRFDLLVGARITPGSGFLQGQRFAVEYGQPVYQNLDGPQLETDWTATIGWQWAL